MEATTTAGAITAYVGGALLSTGLAMLIWGGDDNDMQAGLRIESDGVRVTDARVHRRGLYSMPTVGVTAERLRGTNRIHGPPPLMIRSVASARFTHTHPDWIAPVASSLVT